MRRRGENGLSKDGDDDFASPRGFKKSLKNFDAFPKVKKEFRVQTSNGTTLTVITYFVMALLFMNELSSFFEVRLSWVFFFVKPLFSSFLFSPPFRSLSSSPPPPRPSFSLSLSPLPTPSTRLLHVRRFK
jgi:hypothetical protein